MKQKQEEKEKEEKQERVHTKQRRLGEIISDLGAKVLDGTWVLAKELISETEVLQQITQSVITAV